MDRARADSGSDNESDERQYSSEWAEKYYKAFDPRNNDLTYERWLKLKQEHFKKLDRQTTDRKLGKSNEPTRYEKKKRIKNFEFGIESHDPTEEDFNEYQHAFKNWRKGKKAWKERQGGNTPHKPPTAADVKQYRRALSLTGITHGEWLGLKETEEEMTRHKTENKKSVTFSIGNCSS